MNKPQVVVIILLLFPIFVFGQRIDDQVTIEAKNGNIVKGKLIEIADSSYTIQTEIGTTKILRENVVSIKVDNIQTSEEIKNKTTTPNQSEEARIKHHVFNGGLILDMASFWQYEYRLSKKISVGVCFYEKHKYSKDVQKNDRSYGLGGCFLYSVYNNNNWDLAIQGLVAYGSHHWQRDNYPNEIDGQRYFYSSSDIVEGEFTATGSAFLFDTRFYLTDWFGLCGNLGILANPQYTLSRDMTATITEYEMLPILTLGISLKF